MTKASNGSGSAVSSKTKSSSEKIVLKAVKRSSLENVLRASQSVPSGLKRYTLKRDDDRDLQFDGTLLAESRSNGGNPIHRVALYRTKGGKFISQFSSVLGTPSADPSELRSTKSDFIDKVTFQAEWRREKMLEYPDDKRNRESATALDKMAALLAKVPDTHEYWEMLYQTWQNGDETSNAQEAEYLREYGFNSATLSDPLLFIAEVIDANEVDVEAQLLNSKATVFDDLDEALTFFRPGRLTNALLAKLGKWEPEFIE